MKTRKSRVKVRHQVRNDDTTVLEKVAPLTQNQLLLSIIIQDAAQVKKLLYGGENPNTTTDLQWVQMYYSVTHIGQTALHWAVIVQDKDKAEELLNYGANVNAQDKVVQKYSPLIELGW